MALCEGQRVMGQRVMGQRVMGQRVMGQRVMRQHSYTDKDKDKEAAPVTGRSTCHTGGMHLSHRWQLAAVSSSVTCTVTPKPPFHGVLDIL